MFCPRCGSVNQDTSNFCLKCGQPLQAGAIVRPIVTRKLPWYEQQGFIVLFLIFFFPVGLYLMWRYSKWHLAAKVIITSFFAVVFMVQLANLLTQQDDAGSGNKTVPSINATSSFEVVTSAPSKPPELPASSKEGTITPSYEYEVNADQLIADYDANEIGADEKYKGKYVKVTGIVNYIGKDIFDNAYITIGESDKTFTSIQAYFKDNTEISKAGKLLEGDKVTIIGRVTGGTFNITMKDCVIIE